MSKRWTPAAGDFIWIDFDPQAGHEQAGHRPAIVISEATYNRAASLAIVRPITTQVKGYPFEVPIPAGEALTGVVLADQVKSLDLKARRAKLAGHASRVVLETTQQYLSVILGFSE